MSQFEHRASIACLLVTNLPVKAERGRYPGLRRRPLVIVERCGGSDIVLDSSSEAEGVSLGMTLPEALKICGNATVMQADQEYYGDADDRIAHALENRFANVERDGLGRAYVQVDGDASPYGEAHLVSTLLNAAPTGFNPRVGVGPGRFISYALAVTAPDGGTLRAPRDPHVFLKDCTVDVLPLPRKDILRLHKSGLYTLGALADVPYAGLQTLLGSDARLVKDLALGIEDTPLPDALQSAA